jgi:hypothetical protein
MPTIKIVPFPGVPGPQGPRGLQGVQGETGLTGPMGPDGDTPVQTEYNPKFGAFNQDESSWTTSDNIEASYSVAGDLINFEIFSESFPNISWQSSQLAIELPANASTPSSFFGYIRGSDDSRYLIMANVSTGQKKASLWHLSSFGTFDMVTPTAPFNLSNDTFHLSGSYFKSDSE